MIIRSSGCVSGTIFCLRHSVPLTKINQIHWFWGVGVKAGILSFDLVGVLDGSLTAFERKVACSSGSHCAVIRVVILIKENRVSQLSS